MYVIKLSYKKNIYTHINIFKDIVDMDLQSIFIYNININQLFMFLTICKFYHIS
jgi:hypothetical protein